MNRKFFSFVFSALAAMALLACGGGDGDENSVDPSTEENENHSDDMSRLLGGDISMYPSYKDFGTEYKDIDGNRVELLPFFAKNGMNAMRVRLFVNPTKAKSVIQDLEYVKRLAHMIKDGGFKFMLDFHYSDTWADPAQQTVPAAWKGLDSKALVNKLYTYTKDVLSELTADGIAPDYIQTGNEISYGMLWPTANVGYTSENKWDIFCEMLSSAAKACREVSPKAKIILHIERSGDVNSCISFIKHVKNVDYDILGLSYYPFWHGKIDTLDQTLKYIESTTDKNIMIVEFAYYYAWYPTGDDVISASVIGFNGDPDGQQAVTAALVKMLNEHPRVKGLFWWFPEENECPYTALLDGWANRGLFNNETGRALPALYELKSFLDNKK